MADWIALGKFGESGATTAVFAGIVFRSTSLADFAFALGISDIDTSRDLAKGAASPPLWTGRSETVTLMPAGPVSRDSRLWSIPGAGELAPPSSD
jgi:hypothetical protein